jgi:glycosyltransferase involved in cell wall biosynthesis
MNPTISAIITTYNYARFLPAAIESVLGQTRPADEIIVVDDGSTDDTRDVLARYTERGVRYLYKENGGVSSARNLGIRESRGSLLAFLDADDEWLPGKLALQVEHFARYPQAGLVTGSEWEIDDEGRRAPWLNRREPAAARWIYPQILIENQVGSPSLVMVSRECLDNAGTFDEELRLAQDWDLWIRIAKEYPVGVVDAPLIHYRRHRASMSAGPVWSRYISNRAFHHRYIRPIRQRRMRTRLLLAAQSMNLFYAAAQIEESGERRASALSLALLALALDHNYQAKLKWAAVLRAALGESAFNSVKAVMGHRV